MIEIASAVSGPPVADDDIYYYIGELKLEKGRPSLCCGAPSLMMMLIMYYYMLARD